VLSENNCERQSVQQTRPKTEYFTNFPLEVLDQKVRSSYLTKNNKRK